MEVPERKKSRFPPEGLKDTELACSDHWEITLWTNSSQHSSKRESQASEMINPAGKGWWIHLLISKHTATQFKGAGWVLLRAVLAPSLSSWPCKGENPAWEQHPAADTGPAQARNPAHEFHQHFTISKCILPHRAYWARMFSLLLSSWDIGSRYAWCFSNLQE